MNTTPRTPEDRALEIRVLHEALKVLDTIPPSLEVNQHRAKVWKRIEEIEAESAYAEQLKQAGGWRLEIKARFSNPDSVLR